MERRDAHGDGEGSEEARESGGSGGNGPPRGRRRRRDRAAMPDPPYGRAHVSQLIRLMCSPNEEIGWTPARRRAHAQALVALASDHWFTDDELEAIERVLG